MKSAFRNQVTLENTPDCFPPLNIHTGGKKKKKKHQKLESWGQWLFNIP